MPTRRTALKTLAGTAVVGSLSGCVRLATQETVEVNGTAATVSGARGSPAETAGNDGSLALGVGVEARRPIERFGVRKELIAAGWGVLYWIAHPESETPTRAIATFTTPSISIAGQEMNPIAELTVGEISTELASLALSTGDPLSAHPDDFDGFLDTKIVENADGQAVLRAFREASGFSAVHVDQRLDSPDYVRRSPDWDGEYHEFQATYERDGESHEFESAVVFDEHNGDFVVVSSVARDGDQLYRPQGSIDRTTSITHPPDDEFSREGLLRHLAETNLGGARRVVSQGRTLIDETQSLLAEARNDERDEEDDRVAAITDTQDVLGELEGKWVDIGKGLESLSTDTLAGEAAGDTLRRLRDRSAETVEIATRARDRGASYTDTRNGADDRVRQIERNLAGIVALAKDLAAVTDKHYAWYEGFA